jgi:hypothetical protein
MAIVEIVPPAAEQVVPMAVARLLASGAQHWSLSFQDQGHSQPPLQAQPVLVGGDRSVKCCAGCRGHESDANAVLLLEQAGLLSGWQLIQQSWNGFLAQGVAPPSLLCVLLVSF